MERSSAIRLRLRDSGAQILVAGIDKVDGDLRVRRPCCPEA
jgi:hypothetical protein